MSTESRQFNARKECKPVERKSSFYLKIDKYDELATEAIINSKRIHFLDGDDCWVLSVRKRFDKFEFRYALDVTENIWRSKIWSYSISGAINGSDIWKSKSCIVEKRSVAAHYVLMNRNVKSVEVKFTMTISPLADLPSDTSSIEKFVCPTVQYQQILLNNKKLLDEPKYSDFTFVVEDQKFKVHKNVLAAASPLFEHIFDEQCRETNECEVTDIKPTVFQYLLQFIYCGEVPEKIHEVALSLYEAAHWCQIDELKEICMSVERFHLSKDNAFEAFQWAEKYGMENLKKDAWNIIQYEILAFVATPPPPVEFVRSMIENQIEMDNFVEESRRKLGEIEKTGRDLLKKNANRKTI